MADVFEDHPDVVGWRIRLFNLIEDTPFLDWQLLTKRPENVLRMVPERWACEGWPLNVWLGVSVEDQRRANERILALLEIPAAIRFLSCEPLLGPLNLHDCGGFSALDDTLDYIGGPGGGSGCPHPTVDWVIAGGESGRSARPMHPAWVRRLRDDCDEAGVPFLFKQWGEWRPFDSGPWREPECYVSKSGWVTKFGQDPLDTDDANGDWAGIWRFGKHAAGRELDGREWTEFPVSAALKQGLADL